jgi:hypothetical protein
MNTLMLRGGQAMGVLGFVLMALAVSLRLSGRYIIGGFESGSLLQGGIASMAAGCFALLWVLIERGKG